MPAPETFTTERLVARRIDRDDQPFVESMYRAPEVYATLGGPRDAAAVEQTVGRMVDHWARRGFGAWILRDRATGQPVGWVGLHDTDVGGAGGVELLYAIASDRWREGLATEAGRAVLAIARDDLGLAELVCFTLTDNVASQRTMAGLGFIDAGPVEHAGLPHLLTRLALTRTEVGDRG